MLAAVWVPYNLGKTALPALLSLKTLLAGQEPHWGPQPPAANGNLAEFLLVKSMAILSRVKLALQSAGVGVDAGGNPQEPLSPLSRLAARLEVSLTGLALQDWICLCLGYCKSPLLCMISLLTQRRVSILPSN